MYVNIIVGDTVYLKYKGVTNVTSTHSCPGDHLLVQSNEPINGSFSDLKRWKMRKKVVANKEAHEHPVIYGSLHVTWT